ncbi:DUF692 domain-containing protein [uncultured Oxalicibacterium sp.]|uniref:DUF692 domain-containing protein n=1 Tax=uncultured Oxalicibacterium sp. TaxID=1168540 RepID=UPI0025D4DACC|nr:DUF692 domain-containing protein [uncultured Oxalicibacterium sp.]
MAGLGYRREMADWDMAQVDADFFEVAPENWIHRDRAPLYRLLNAGYPVRLHGVSLNLGGQAPIQRDFLRDVRGLIEDLQADYYSDHLAASGDAHQLYDLFPIPFTDSEVIRVSDRIKQVQDVLGQQIAVENTTYYTNVGIMSEAEFLMKVVERADCNILLDLNNIVVNHKNHHQMDLQRFLAHIDLQRVTYMHVAGHELDDRFGLYIDTHSQPVESTTRELALELHHRYDIPVLLEWDNDIPNLATLNQELSCLKTFIST